MFWGGAVQSMRSLFKNQMYAIVIFQYHGGLEQQMWLPAPVSDDFLCVAAGI